MDNRKKGPAVELINDGLTTGIAEAAPLAQYSDIRRIHRRRAWSIAGAAF